MKPVFLPLTIAVCIVLSAESRAATLTFEAADFAVTPVFSTVPTFDFTIDLAGPLAAGASYSNPALNTVIYNVSGNLNQTPPTPSGFPAFALHRSISGAEFYAQGSSLNFTISALADLSDGLQVSELTAVAGDPVFEFDGREVGTGRYHPALVQLYANGSGSIRNSNNVGGENPVSGNVVDVDYGEEYITDLAFDASALTLADAAVVPVPAAAWLFASALLALGASKRRNSRQHPAG